MPSYLIKSGPAPFSGADICKELGIENGYFELLIDSVIEGTCIRQSARSEVWAVTVGPDFERSIKWASGRVPAEIGPEYELPGYGMVRDCRYEPSPERVAKARQTVINWCLNSNDRDLMAAIHAGEPARKAREQLRAQLEASVAA